MTHPTKAVMQMMLRDFLRVSNISVDDQIYDDRDLANCVSKVEIIDFHQERMVNGIKFTPYNAGHVLGACMFLIEIGGVKVLYTGDYSLENDRHLMGACLEIFIAMIIIINDHSHLTNLPYINIHPTVIITLYKRIFICVCIHSGRNPRCIPRCLDCRVYLRCSSASECRRTRRPLHGPSRIGGPSWWTVRMINIRDLTSNAIKMWTIDDTNSVCRCLIPVFALGRTQELLLILDEHWQAHPDLHRVPIYFASKLAAKALRVYQTYINMMNDRIRKQISISNPFDFQHISNLKSLDEFDDSGPSVVMASPGRTKDDPRIIYSHSQMTTQIVYPSYIYKNNMTIVWTLFFARNASKWCVTTVIWALVLGQAQRMFDSW